MNIFYDKFLIKKPKKSKINAWLLLFQSKKFHIINIPKDAELIWKQPFGEVWFKNKIFYGFFQEDTSPVKSKEDYNKNYTINLIKNPNAYFDICINLIDFYFSYYLENKGIHRIHSSCISNGKECILIIGPKNSGKSTFALSLLTYQYKMVSDDQAFIIKKKNQFNVIPFYQLMKVKQKNIELIPTFLISSINMKRDVFNYLAPELKVRARLKSTYGDISTIVDVEESGFKIEKKSVPLKAIIFMKLTGKIKSKIKLIENQDSYNKVLPFFFEKDYYRKDYLIDEKLIIIREKFCKELCEKIPLYQLQFGVDYSKIGTKIKKIIHF